MCENCTYINQDTHIECQICQHAPWKRHLKGQQLVPLAQNLAAAERSDRHADETWKCGACTLINTSSDNKCTTCENRRPEDECQRSPNRPEEVTQQPPPYVSPGHHRSRSDITIPGTMDQSTQTEGLDAGNPAQKVMGQIGRICKLVRNRGSPKPSRDTSPLTHTSASSLAPEDSAKACWPCSQCANMNSMDRTDCERCGFEDASPAAIIPSHTTP